MLPELCAELGIIGIQSWGPVGWTVLSYGGTQTVQKSLKNTGKRNFVICYE